MARRHLYWLPALFAGIVLSTGAAELPEARVPLFRCNYAPGVARRIKTIDGTPWCEAYIVFCTYRSGDPGSAGSARVGPSEALCPTVNHGLSCDDADACANDQTLDVNLLEESGKVPRKEILADLCLDTGKWLGDLGYPRRTDACVPGGKPAQEQAGNDEGKPRFKPNRPAKGSGSFSE